MSTLNACSAQFKKGLISLNPLFVLVLGNCAALAVTLGVDASFAYSGGMAFVMMGTAVVVSIIRNVTPNIVRIPVYIIIVASFVTVVDLVFQAFLPDIWLLLGIYLPLLTVNCVVLARAEVFASKNGIALSVADALGMSVGFMFAMLVISIPRMILGTGEFILLGKTLFTLPVLSDNPIAIMVMPPGAFLVMALLHGLFRRIGVVKSE
ncbi:MAG: electron transport complex subunit RsxE [Chloroflexi bacterium]|jgi:Na+-translocating ferredoxin:NAD+ oxidoreductase subunit E|nr:electron transport complex subunit RsxE [Chloroflexota bacterium]MBT7081172.1 electron transport complex subunit RsxE [Chloroflexota bacterium]MBT7288949.1 electron transport complex subunit RsxE [Chloroflexota bacterium]